MKTAERDELLIRLDERSNNTWRSIEEMKDHLIRLNGSMGEQNKQISSNRTSIKWIVRVFAAMIILGGSAFGIINWLG